MFHYLTGLTLTGNLLSGLAINSSLTFYERFDVTLLNSFVTDNKWNGIDINATRKGISSIHSKKFDIQRNFIGQNGQFMNGRYGPRPAGLAIQLGKADIVVIQNNAFWKNKEGAVRLKLEPGIYENNVSLFDNDIEQNIAGHTVDVSLNSGALGSTHISKPRLHIVGNRISHNSAGIQYDTLSIDNVAANVVNNTFFNDTSRHVIRWVVGSQSSVGGQQCVDNTLYLNIGQTPNYRWSLYADGVGPRYLRNLFYNPSNLYEFVSGRDRGQGRHDARNNWWGTSDLNKAEARVRDKNDVSSLAAVDINPIDITNPWDGQSGTSFLVFNFTSVSCHLYVYSLSIWLG